MLWKEIDFSGKIESKFLFRTAIFKSILPFALFKPNLIVLPIIIEPDEFGAQKINLLDSDELRSEGYLNTAKWFKNAENIWAIHRTEKNESSTLENYLNWNNKLVCQNINAPFLVLYNASANYANATVIKRKNYNLPFIVESKTYVCSPHSLNEAYYLTAILNSNIANILIKDFQTKGLFDARDIHKKILYIYYPLFDLKDEVHQKLAGLS